MRNATVPGLLATGLALAAVLGPLGADPAEARGRRGWRSGPVYGFVVPVRVYGYAPVYYGYRGAYGYYGGDSVLGYRATRNTAPLSRSQRFFREVGFRSP